MIGSPPIASRYSASRTVFQCSTSRLPSLATYRIAEMNSGFTG